MKNNVRPIWPAPPEPGADPSAPEKDQKPMSRVTLALLDEYSLELQGGHGYDPYNATIPPGVLRPRRRSG